MPKSDYVNKIVYICNFLNDSSLFGETAFNCLAFKGLFLFLRHLGSREGIKDPNSRLSRTV